MVRAGKIAAGVFCLALLTVAILWQIHRSRLAREAASTRQLAERGDAKAEAELSTAYYYGRGVPQSYEQAFQWAQKAAKQGNRRAEYDLGYLYQFGQGVTADDAEAFSLFQKSAEQGEMRAQNALGNMYYYGRGVQEDRPIAAVWYRKAADQGLAGAEYALGYCYEYGQGVPKNQAEADRWNRKAAAQGYKWAQQALGLRGYGFSTRQIVFWLAETAGFLWLLVLSKPFARNSRDANQRALMQGSLFGLVYAALRIYWAYGSFPSLGVVDVFALVKGFVLGITVVLLASGITPKATRAVLIFSSVLIGVTIAAIVFVVLRHVPGRSLVAPLCSLGGLLFGLVTALSVTSRSARKEAPPELAA